MSAVDRAGKALEEALINVARAANDAERMTGGTVEVDGERCVFVVEETWTELQDAIAVWQKRTEAFLAAQAERDAGERAPAGGEVRMSATDKESREPEADDEITDRDRDPDNIYLRSGYLRGLAEVLSRPHDRTMLLRASRSLRAYGDLLRGERLPVTTDEIRAAAKGDR